MQRFIKVNSITAVDLDKYHFAIAKQFFEVDSGVAKLDFVCQEAGQYVQTCRRKFDVIVEDLFINQDEQKINAVRAIQADGAWVKRLGQRITKEGILIMNFESSIQLRTSLTSRILKQAGFASLWEFTLPHYENAIAVLSKSPLNRDWIEENLVSYHPYIRKRGDYIFTMKRRQ